MMGKSLEETSFLPLNYHCALPISNPLKVGIGIGVTAGLGSGFSGRWVVLHQANFKYLLWHIYFVSNSDFDLY